MSIDLAKSRTIIGGFVVMTLRLPPSAFAAVCSCVFETLGGTAAGALRIMGGTIGAGLREGIGGTAGAGLREIVGGTTGAGDDGRETVGIGMRGGCLGSILTTTSGCLILSDFGAVGGTEGIAIFGREIVGGTTGAGLRTGTGGGVIAEGRETAGCGAGFASSGFAGSAFASAAGSGFSASAAFASASSFWRFSSSTSCAVFTYLGFSGAFPAFGSSAAGCTACCGWASLDTVAAALKSFAISSAYRGAIALDDVLISKPYLSLRWLMNSISSLLGTFSCFANACILMLI